MRSNYKKIGPYIREVVEKNSDLAVELLLGVSVSKEFIPSIANIIGTDMSTYKIVRKNQFAYGPVTSRNSDKVSIALLNVDGCIVSTSYTVFEIIDHDTLLPEYLMMWFRRPEFDRYARFKSHGSVRELFDWEEMCDVELPMPSIEKQREIVKEYHTIVDRIKLNERLNQKLEETAQTIYKRWFVDFEFPISAEYAAAIGKPELEGQPYKSSGGEMVFNDVLKQEIPKGWEDKPLSELTSKIGSGATPTGGKESYLKSGIPLVRSLNVFDYAFSYDGLAFIDNRQAAKLDNVALHEGDVLLNITGVSVARCCIVPASILPARVNQHVMIIRPKSEIPISHYLLCLLCSSDYKQKLLGSSESGSTRQALTKTEVEALSVLFPFNKVLDKFEEKARAVFTYWDNLTHQNNTLNQVLQNLLSMLATSRLQ